jgi:hypothetical protein
MEVWSVSYQPGQSSPCSEASHIQVGPYQASKKDVSITASSSLAAADTHEVAVASEVNQ